MLNNKPDPFVITFEKRAQLIKGCLSGLSVGIKDLFHIAGVPTAAGNPDWAKTHETPDKTSTTVEKLVLAGASIKGKTLTDELAYSLNGQNIHYSALENPKAKDRIPGGSSSGSAVAVSLHEVDIGLGTDTGGSIRVPASYQGLFGLRPTHGLITDANMVSLAPSFDTVGWLTRDLLTLSKILDVFEFETPTSKVNRLLFAPETIELCEHQEMLKQALQDAPIELVALDLPLNFLSDACDAFRHLQGAEIWLEHGQWIEQCKPIFAADIETRINWCKTITTEQIHKAKQTQRRLKSWFQEQLKPNDMLFWPTTPGPAPKVDCSENFLATYRNQLLALTSPAGLAGLPQLHIPLSAKNDGPVGFSLIGNHNSEKNLVQVATTIFGCQ